MVVSVVSVVVVVVAAAAAAATTTTSTTATTATTNQQHYRDRGGDSCAGAVLAVVEVEFIAILRIYLLAVTISLKTTPGLRSTFPTTGKTAFSCSGVVVV